MIQAGPFVAKVRALATEMFEAIELHKPKEEDAFASLDIRCYDDTHQQVGLYATTYIV